MCICGRAALAVRRAISNQYIASRTHADGVIHANTMQTTPLMARADLPLCMRVGNPADKLARRRLPCPSSAPILVGN